MKEGRRRIVSSHEVLADEEGVEAGATQFHKICVRSQPRLGYRKAIVGDVLDQFEGCFHARGGVATVACRVQDFRHAWNG